MNEQTRQEIERLMNAASGPLKSVWKSLDLPTISSEPVTYKCEKCHDAKWIRFTKDGYDFVQECECSIAERARKRIERSGLKNVIEQYTFSAYKPDEQWQENILNKAQQYTDILKNKAQSPLPWFFIGGNAGAGKTHICTAICGEMLNAGKRVLYMQWSRDARLLKSCITEQEEFDSQIDPYISCDVLYIDDLFKSRGLHLEPTEADLRLAYQIINARYAADLPTIISCEWYLNTELIAVDEATFSRIIQRCGREYNIAIPRGYSKNYRLSHLQ